MKSEKKLLMKKTNNFGASLMDRTDDHFRVYSERTLDAGTFMWNPFMDLLGVLPSDTGNHSVSVFRLIDDKQSGSPLLFNEKVPFRPTAIGWVPDKRGLTVGDASGNVFVFDAERQRTIELQKVHDCAVLWIHWVSLGTRSPQLIESALHTKLPRIFATPGSIQHLFWENTALVQSDNHIDDSPEIFNESLSCSSIQTILSVLGSQGNVQLYYGGSIPVGEFALRSLFDISNHVEFLSGSMSDDSTTFAVLGESKLDTQQACLFLINTGVLKLRQEELFTAARAQSDIDWLLRSLNQSVSIIDRAVSSSFDEMSTSLGALDELDDDIIDHMVDGRIGPRFIQDFMNREFTAPNKLAKLARTCLSAYDYLLSCLLSRVGVIIDHLIARATVLIELEHPGQCGSFGLTPENVSGLMDRILNNLVPCVKSLIKKTQENSLAMKHIFAYLEALVDSSKPSSCIPASVAGILRKDRRLVVRPPVISSLLDEGKQVELLYVQMLSNQRRTISSRIVPKKALFWSRQRGRGSPQLRLEGVLAETVWEEDEGRLLVLTQTNIRSGESESRFQLKAPEGSVWLLPRFYQEGQICAILVHAGAASICVISYSDLPRDLKEIGPDEYGFPEFFIAQQIPSKGRPVVSMEVSGPRGLCSIYCEGGHMITLDLENADDELADDDADQEQESESSNSPEPPKRERRNLKKLDSLIGGENVLEPNTPDAPVVQRLRFVD
jgi:hypothetical protein